MMNGVRILHIICHGTYNESYRDSSKLYFEHSDRVGLEDYFGISTIKEILNEEVV
jgi:hypothetical protein